MRDHRGRPVSMRTLTKPFPSEQGFFEISVKNIGKAAAGRRCQGQGRVAGQYMYPDGGAPERADAPDPEGLMAEPQTGQAEFIFRVENQGREGRSGVGHSQMGLQLRKGEEVFQAA